jgi:hypothetical protein
MKSRRSFWAFILTGIIAVALTAAAPKIAAGGGNTQGNSSHGLAGTWKVNVTRNNLPPFKSLATFTTDGTLVLTNNVLGFLESTGHGVWTRTSNREFAVTAMHFEFNANSQFVATAKTRITLTLDETGDRFGGPFIAEVFDASGNVILTVTGDCQGERVEVEPLN